MTFWKTENYKISKKIRGQEGHRVFFRTVVDIRHYAFSELIKLIEQKEWILM